MVELPDMPALRSQRSFRSDQCRRKIAANAALEDEEIRRLKKLSALPLWAGSVVHDSIEAFLRERAAKSLWLELPLLDQLVRFAGRSHDLRPRPLEELGRGAESLCPIGRLRAAFLLYVPSSMVEVARRLCDDNQIAVSEIWSYHTVGDEVRFTLVHRAKEVARPAPLPRPSLPSM